MGPRAWAEGLACSPEKGGLSIMKGGKKETVSVGARSLGDAQM